MDSITNHEATNFMNDFVQDYKVEQKQQNYDERLSKISKESIMQSYEEVSMENIDLKMKIEELEQTIINLKDENEQLKISMIARV